MNEERKRILQMVEDGTITADEAMMLLEQLGTEKPAHAMDVYRPEMDDMSTSGAKMLRVRVHMIEKGKQSPTTVNVNLPLTAARLAGKLIKNVMPEQAKDAVRNEGIDLSGIDFEAMIDALEAEGGDIVNIIQDDDEEQVRVRVYIG